MGAWGPGLYSDDFALDLRPAISAICRLPLDGPEIVALLSGLNPAANDANDEEHSTFWLVTADQLHRRGIESSATERAIEIIEQGTDIAMMSELGMVQSDIRKRTKNLDKLRASLAEPLPVKQRKTLKKPQPLLLDPGDVFAYPTDSQGNGVNPYFSDAETETRFKQTGWSSFMVTAAGHALDYLAWYEVAPSRVYTRKQPTFRRAMSKIDPKRGAVGTFSKTALRRLRLERLGNVDGVGAPKPPTDRTISVVASDISASNALSKYAPSGTYP